MFLSRTVYDDLRMQVFAVEAEVIALRSTNIQLTAQIEWMRAWLTKSEFERSQLIKKYMGVDIPVPIFEQDTEQPDPNQVPLSFNDVGDEGAAKLGVSWNADGTLHYEPKAS